VTAPRAADLPVGSVVATRSLAYIKKPNSWPVTGFDADEEGFKGMPDVGIDQLLSSGSAQVLRVGDGNVR
jgi:hypothetical protein